MASLEVSFETTTTLDTVVPVRSSVFRSTDATVTAATNASPAMASLVFSMGPGYPRPGYRSTELVRRPGVEPGRKAHKTSQVTRAFTADSRRERSRTSSGRNLGPLRLPFRHAPMVLQAGVEPARPCGHRHLRPARLPPTPLEQWYEAGGSNPDCRRVGPMPYRLARLAWYGPGESNSYGQRVELVPYRWARSAWWQHRDLNSHRGLMRSTSPPLGLLPGRRTRPGSMSPVLKRAPRTSSIPCSVP